MSTLATLPDDHPAYVPQEDGRLMETTVGAIRDAEPELVTTAYAERRWSYSQDQWARWAKAGEIEGAFQDGPGGMWRLPLASCRDKIRSLRPSRRRRSREPWSASAQARGVGSPDLPEGKVVRLRPPAVGDGQADHAEPESAGLAGPGRADAAQGGR